MHDAQCNELWQTYFKKWFVAMVASWMYDDVVNHQVLVLVGRQGTGKTTWLEHLLPPELRDYVTKQASVRELNVLKSLITTADVNERAAYGHTKERRLRVASQTLVGCSAEQVLRKSVCMVARRDMS